MGNGSPGKMKSYGEIEAMVGLSESMQEQIMRKLSFEENKLKLLKKQGLTLEEISAEELSNELTLILQDFMRTLSPIDFALFYLNREIVVNCPNILRIYAFIDQVLSLSRSPSLILFFLSPPSSFL